MIYKGVDISKYQGNIDWEKAYKEIDFAIIRAGCGFNNDSHAKQNLYDCNRLNIPVGVYWFSYAFSEAEAKREAEMCYNLIKDYKIEYPVYFDFEEISADYATANKVTVNKEFVSKIAKAFCNSMENKGYFAGIYSNENMFRFFDDEVLNLYTLWYANWNGENKHKAKLWQYSNKGKISGVQGVVDLNYCYENFPDIIRKASLNNLGKVSITEIRQYLEKINNLLERGERNGFRP